jgi:hypothetical protein
MPVAITVTEQIKSDLELVVRGTMVFSGTYPTGGEPISLAGLGIKTNKLTPKVMEIVPQVPAGFILSYDYTNAKCFVHCNTAGGANAGLGEHTNATYVAGVVSPAVHRFEAILNP